MTEVIIQQQHQQASITSSIQSSPTTNDGLYQQHTTTSATNNNNTNQQHSTLSPVALDCGRKRRRQLQEDIQERENQLNLVGFFFTAFRRSVFGCSSCESDHQGKFSVCFNNSHNTNSSDNNSKMEIGLPTNVRHVAHVTFDRFNGFLGLPVEFEPEVPRRAPSASTTVFGVSTNSMQLSFDTRGNSVPTILLLMQHRLYALGGLLAEGIFRINPDNGQEEYVRDQLNQGLIPDDVDVHCLAGLIKAWFRELPTGILDCLSAEQVMQSQTEDECTQLARLLPPTEAALLDWAINLMADVAQFEHENKMNARNVAMVFAPNMTHMADPLTALMHAVQVMNFLKTLIEKTLKEREDAILDTALVDSSSRDPSGGNGQYTPLQTIIETNEREEEEEKHFKSSDPCAEDETYLDAADSSTSNHQEDESRTAEPKTSCNDAAKSDAAKPGKMKIIRNGQTSTSKKGPKKTVERKTTVLKSAEKSKGTSLVSSVNLRTERVEAWR